MDDWEKEDYEAPVPRAIPSDKWEGEDEEEEIKDNWEDEDEEKKPDDSLQSTDSKPAVYQRPKKKPLAERLAEKSRAKQAEDEILEQQRKELTPEEKLAEKIKLQKIQEEADLKLAKGLFGVGDSSSGAKGIDGMFPETKEQFDEFAEALKNKILFFESSKLYSQFIEKLLNDISLTLPVDDIKRIGVTLNSLYHEKERLRKEQTKSKKKKQKATIRLDKADDMGLADEARAGEYYDDDDDFI